MSVVGAPQPWPPPPPPSTPPSTTTTVNCLPGICTVNCRQYCNYFYLQPPPLPQQQQFLPDNTSSDDNDSKSISPLMAALIALLTAAFLLLFYYTVISRLCRNRNNRRNNTTRRSSSQRVDPLVHDPVRPDTGLDQSFIRQITVFKYKRDDGLIEGTECAVCLGEFNEEESLRLMPNCEHAFHIPCIDTWLENNSNCPLCRSGMNPIPAAPSVGGVSVAASRFERVDDHVVVVREVERLGQVVVQVVADDDKDVT